MTYPRLAIGDVEEAFTRNSDRVADAVRACYKTKIVVESDEISTEDIRSSEQFERVIEKLRDQLYERAKEKGAIPVKAWAIVTRHMCFKNIVIQMECDS
jgi:hypothetical protein